MSQRDSTRLCPGGLSRGAALSSGREHAPRRATGRAACRGGLRGVDGCIKSKFSPLFCLFMLLSVVLFPTDALAASNPSVVYSNNGLKVVAPCDNGFDAALTTIGLFSVRPRLTSEMRTKLSNASTGGAFYELAERFQQQNNTLEGFGDAVYIGVLTYNTALYGAGNIMQATGVTSADVEDARRDFNVIQNGGSLGGDVGVVGDTMQIVMQRRDWKPGVAHNVGVYQNCTYDSENNSVTTSSNTAVRTDWADLPTTYSYRVTGGVKSKIERAVSDAASSGQIVLFFQNWDSANQFLYLVYPDGYETEPTSNGGLRIKFTRPAERRQFRGHRYLTNLYQLTSGDYVLCYNGSVSNEGSTSYSAGGSDYFENFYFVNYPLVVGGGGGGNETNNWPDDYLTGRPIETEPPVPTPPVYDPVTYPDPTDDPLPTPPPETPVTPVNPIVTTDPTNSTPQDYTPWLQAILNELRNFHRDAIGIGNNICSSLTNHCTHITTTITQQIQWFYNNLKAQIRSGVQAILNGLDQNCTEMMDYLEDLMQWLSDQLQFTFNIDATSNPVVDVPAYNDSSVVSWLQRIYNAIRNIHGPTIGTPVSDKDVEDEFDWWEWLFSLIDQLFDGIMSDLVGDIQGFLQGFSEEFPFSVPWDLVLAFTALSATPVTPAWTVTIPSILGIPSYTYQIDMSPYNDLAATVRAMEFFVFAFYLALKSKWLLDLLWEGAQGAIVYFDGVLGG